MKMQTFPFYVSKRRQQLLSQLMDRYFSLLHSPLFDPAHLFRRHLPISPRLSMDLCISSSMYETSPLLLQHETPAGQDRKVLPAFPVSSHHPFAPDPAPPKRPKQCSAKSQALSKTTAIWPFQPTFVLYIRCEVLSATLPLPATEMNKAVSCHSHSAPHLCCAWLRLRRTTVPSQQIPMTIEPFAPISAVAILVSTHNQATRKNE